MATKFADISKSVKDLLSDDYTTKYVLKTKKQAGPVTVTIETEQDKTGAISTKVGATKCSYAKFNLDKYQVAADGGKVLETSLALSPELKVTFKTKDGTNLGVEYTKGSLATTTTLDVVELSKLSGSACFGLNSGFILGLDATYSLKGKSTGLAGFNYGLAYKTGPMFASVTASKKNAFTIGLLYKLSPSVSLVSETVHTSEKLCDIKGIGAAYKIPTTTFNLSGLLSASTVKAKMGSDGVLHACWVAELTSKTTLAASGSVKPSDLSTFKPGISITI